MRIKFDQKLDDLELSLKSIFQVEYKYLVVDKIELILGAKCVNFSKYCHLNISSRDKSELS